MPPFARRRPGGRATMTAGTETVRRRRAGTLAAADRADGGSFEYRLQRTSVGVVILDAARCIRAANPMARRLLTPDDAPLFGVDILALHPEAARAKVEWLIDSARDAADGAASLVVTTPMGSLVAKVTRLQTGPAVDDAGYCMMFHALGDISMAETPGDPARGSPAGEGPRHLLKLPLMRGKGGVTTLIDVDQVACLAAQGHYAVAKTLQFSAFCPRSLADLERRLDPALFLRVHRRHLVSIRHVLAAERRDGRWHLLMADQAGTRVPVSRGKVELVRRLLAV